MTQTIEKHRVVTFLRGAAIKQMTIYSHGPAWLIRVSVYGEGEYFLSDENGLPAQFESFSKANEIVMAIDKEAFPQVYALNEEEPKNEV